MRALSTYRATLCFYPHAPGGARRLDSGGAFHPGPCFYPHAPGGARRRRPSASLSVLKRFYPHAPGGARRSCPVGADWLSNSFYPHAPGGARPFSLFAKAGEYSVSIRTPRAGRDDATDDSAANMRVSIRTPRAGRDSDDPRDLYDNAQFLSARPGRGATSVSYPSIDFIEFLSARPGRGATCFIEPVHKPPLVSIRTPRAGRDAAPSTRLPRQHCFYPHAPGGARHD